MNNGMSARVARRMSRTIPRQRVPGIATPVGAQTAKAVPAAPTAVPALRGTDSGRRHSQKACQEHQRQSPGPLHASKTLNKTYATPLRTLRPGPLPAGSDLAPS